MTGARLEPVLHGQVSVPVFVAEKGRLLMPIPDPIVTVVPPGLARRAAPLLLGLLLAGCIIPSEAEIKREFQEYVDSASSCTRDDECALVSAACPLGCFVAARADRKADVEAKARALVEAYQRGGRSCAYECIAAPPVACRQQRCLLLSDQPPDAGSD